SPIRTPASRSTSLALARSHGPKRFCTSGVENFTLRSELRTIAATPVAISTSAMLVTAGDVASTGNGTTGALGNSSTACATAVAVWVLVGIFTRRGRSQLVQRIPCAIDEPHMRQVVAIRSPGSEDVTPDGRQRQRDRFRRRSTMKKIVVIGAGTM